MTELLITGGCSNSDPNYYSYQKNNIMVWPKIISVENGWDLINVARQGASNDSIENSVYDVVLNNLDKDIFVMVFWTEPCRVNLWNIDYFQTNAPRKKYTDYSRINEIYSDKADQEKFSEHFDNLDNFSYDAWLKYRNYLDDRHDKETIDMHYKISFLIQDLFKKYLDHIAYEDEEYHRQDEIMLDSSLRCVKRLKDFLESHNVKYAFRYSLSLTGNISLSYPWWQEDISNLPLEEKLKISKRDHNILKYCKNHPIVKELEMNWNDIKDGFCNDENREYLLECGHPNQKGHDKIAELFVEMYNE